MTDGKGPTKEKDLGERPEVELYDPFSLVFKIRAFADGFDWYFEDKVINDDF